MKFTKQFHILLCHGSLLDLEGRLGIPQITDSSKTIQSHSPWGRAKTCLRVQTQTPVQGGPGREAGSRRPARSPLDGKINGPEVVININMWACWSCHLSN